MVEGTHYTIVNHTAGGAGDVKVTATGEPLFDTTDQWIISRVSPFTQLVDLVANVDLPSASIEEADDRAVMLLQELDATVAALSVKQVENLLINGDFRVSQRGASFSAISNDTYCLDRWIAVAEGSGDITVDQETTTVPAGAFAALKATVVDDDVKFGFVTILEERDTKRLAGGKASLSFKARRGTGDNLTLIRAAILEWTSPGVADTVTSDVVSAWNVTGTNPTLETNWAYANTPAALTALTDSYATFQIEDIDIDAGALNLAVFIWSEDTANDVGDELYLADVQLETGATANGFVPRSYAAELALCRRYFERLDFDSVADEGIAYGVASTSGTARMVIPIHVEKRVQPALTSTVAGTFSTRTWTGGVPTDTVCTSVTAVTLSKHFLHLVVIVSGSPFGENESVLLARDSSDVCWIAADSEL
jgi:hypothetical protein